MAEMGKRDSFFLKEMYQALESLGEYTSADMVCKLAESAEKELKCADRKVIELESIGYDISYIYQMQDKMHEKYKGKTEKLKLC